MQQNHILIALGKEDWGGGGWWVEDKEGEWDEKTTKLKTDYVISAASKKKQCLLLGEA